MPLDYLGDTSGLDAYRAAVRSLWHLSARRHIGWLLCAAALLLKLVVPTGFMLDANQGRITVIICSGMAPRTMTMDVPQTESGNPGHGKSTDHGKADAPCPFSGLSAPVVAATDPIQLATLIAFVMSMASAGFFLPPPSSRPHLRPPLRGPPACL